jgi:hypothetical protein
MKRSDTQCIAEDAKPPRKKPNRFNRVFDRGGERVRGLWERNGQFYAQIRVGGRKVRLRLEHAQTVPQVLGEMQALKRQRRAGTLQAPGRRPAPTADGAQAGEKGAQGGGPDSPLRTAIAAYQKDRDALEGKDKKTANREDSGLKKWAEKFGDLPVKQIETWTLDDYRC